MCNVRTLITISLSTSSMMHLITSYQVHTSCKQASQLHITTRSSIVHRWNMPQLTKTSFVSLQHCRNSVQWYLVLNYMLTQITKSFSILVTPHSRVILAGSAMLMNIGQHYIMWNAPKQYCWHFLKALALWWELTLSVGKKADNVVSESESNNEYDSLYSSLLDDREIIDCLLKLPCISSSN